MHPRTPMEKGDPPATSTPAKGPTRAARRRSSSGAKAPALVPQTQAGPRTRILYVDDDPCLRACANLMLARAGYAVETAADGAEALDRIRQRRPDLLITDYHMPGMNGRDLIRELRLAHVDIPVVLASGSLGDVRREDLPGLGCQVMLAKPFTLEQLVAAVRHALGPASCGSSPTACSNSFLSPP